MLYNFNSGYGQILMNQIAASIGPIIGRIFFVIEDSDPSVVQEMMNNLVGYDPSGVARKFGTLAEAYAACTSNANDVIVLSGHTTHALATGIAWSKSRVHVIGMDGGDRITQQGAKIEVSGAVDIAYVLKVTGVRNTFENLKVIQSSTHANALNVVQFAGEGTKWKNCSFLFGTNSNTDLTTSSEALVGEDSGIFINCSFGSDNILSTGARNIFAFDAITGSASGGAGAKNNRFIDCEFIVCSSSASAVLVKVVDTAAVEYLNFFKNCTFHAILHAGAGGVAITNAVQSIASLTGGCINFYLPASFNCTNFCDTLTAKIMTYGPITSVVAGEAGTPT